MTTFKRAHSEEQREARRQSILAVAAAMLAEMRAAELSLNELSRRVGLAKSNVLRYFESREAVLLELVNAESAALLDELGDALPASVDVDASPAVRVHQLAAILAASLAERPVLCDLISEQAAVLERNVSADEVARFKRAAIGHARALVALLGTYLPEMSEGGAMKCATSAMLVAGSVWNHSHPTAAVLAAYEADPELAVLRIEFEPALRDLLGVLFSGVLVREGASLG